MGTVCDGNCGIDLMAMMLQRPQDVSTRARIRQELFQYGMDRWREEWLHDMLVVTQELEQEAVTAHRSCGADGPPEEENRSCGADDPHEQGDEQTEGRAHAADTILLKALEWHTGLKDEGILMSVAGAMPEALRQEQIRLHAASTAQPLPAPAETKIVVRPWLLGDRRKVCQHVDKHCRSCGWTGEGRLPRNSLRSFCRKFKWPANMTEAEQTKAVGRWFRRQNDDDGYGPAPVKGRRRRGGGGGCYSHAAWLETSLYEWWAHMRCSVDWKAVAGRTAVAEERPRMLARFTQSLLVTKAKQSVSEYCVEAMKRGIKPKVPQLRSRWWSKWRRAYGLSLKKPHCKYKVPQWLLQSRFETMILNVAKVRAAAEELLGYDPHILNWDQSPFAPRRIGFCCEAVPGREGGPRSAVGSARRRQIQVDCEPHGVERRGRHPQSRTSASGVDV